jgi:hypothetical protein
LSGNNLTYPKIVDFLSNKIEVLIMNNISNGQSALILDFNTQLFPNLKNLSFESNSLCGPFPFSWRSNGVSVNLKNHSKSLWCSPSVNGDACRLISLNPYSIINENSKSVSLKISDICNVDFSNIKCSNNIETLFENNSIACNVSNIQNIRSEIFLLWSNETISQNVSIYKIQSQYLSYLEGTPAGIIGQNMTVNIKLEKSIPKEIHQHLQCFSGSISIAKTINNTDDQISCVITASKNANVHSGNLVYLRYTFENLSFNVSKSPLYVVVFGNLILFLTIRRETNECEFIDWI